MERIANAMLRWAFNIAVTVALLASLAYGGSMYKREQTCLWTNRCQERLRSLNALLEIYSADRVIEIETKQGKPSKRRVFYPRTLDDLLAAKPESLTEETLRCPIYGVPYRYEQLAGNSYLAYCPARHRFHFDSTSFVNAATPEERDLHLFVKDGKVYQLSGGHANPWDFHTPTRNSVEWDVQPTRFSVDLIKMVEQNPTPIARW